MASNLVYVLHAVSDRLGTDRNTLAIIWTLFVIVGVGILLTVVSRETEEEKRMKRRVD